MRRLLLLLATLVPAPIPAAHAQASTGEPPGYTFTMPTTTPISGQPFFVGIQRTGDWVITGLTSQALANADQGSPPVAFFSVSLDGRVIFTSTMAEYTGPDVGFGAWAIPLAWGLEVPALPDGPHELAATYAGDTLNPPVESTFSFLVHPYQFTLNPPRRPKPLEPRPGTDPDVSPAGFVFLTDEETGAVAVVDIATLLVTDPDTGRPTLNLSSLQGDTVVSYPGDANFPAFNFTYNAPDTPVPAPAAPFALALAVLAVARWRGAALPLSSVAQGSFAHGPHPGRSR
jgi:hypothetical protein